MKSTMKVVRIAGLCLLLFVFLLENGQSQSGPSNQKGLSFDYYTLNGILVKTGEKLSSTGQTSSFQHPYLQVQKSAVKNSKGTVLVLLNSNRSGNETLDEVVSVTHLLNRSNLTTAFLSIDTSVNKDSLLIDGLKAYRLLTNKKIKICPENEAIWLFGVSDAGNLAARMVQYLKDEEQPSRLILINPSGMEKFVFGTVFPEILPPLNPSGSLFVSTVKDGNSSAKATEEYVKTWKGYDGTAELHWLPENKDGLPNLFIKNSPLDSLLSSFLSANPDIKKNYPNPTALPVEGYAKQRHTEKLELLKSNQYDLLMIGNSITNNFEKLEYQPVWQQFFESRHALNLGYSGYRTENILWNLQHGELDGQHPKAVVLEIGTNNVDEKNYPTRHTAAQLAGGIKAIVSLLREKLPESRIIVLRCFPGCYGGPNPTSHRLILERASELVSTIADRKHVFYCDVNHVFLNTDGSINHEYMSDWLHPTPDGAKAWAQSMEPLLSELMGDKNRDIDLPSNSALLPVPKLEEDSYDWWKRHAEVLRIKDSINPEIVLIGNSITHFWGGDPRLKYADGSPRVPNGPKSWDYLFHGRRVLNLGFGWDRTQNVLWRLDHGELDGLHPKTVIIHVGTNNTSTTDHARMNSADEIVEGIRAVYMRVRSKLPSSKILLMEIFPREQSSDHPRRKLIKEVNRRLEEFAGKNSIILLNLAPRMLNSDGTLSPEMAGDFCHPTEKGYMIWAEMLKPFLSIP